MGCCLPRLVRITAGSCRFRYRVPYLSVFCERWLGLAKPVTICTVRWKNPRWVVSCEDGSFVPSEHASHDDAVWTGGRHADHNRPSLLRIYRKNGSFEREHAYAVKRRSQDR